MWGVQYGRPIGSFFSVYSQITSGQQLNSRLDSRIPDDIIFVIKHEFTIHVLTNDLFGMNWSSTFHGLSLLDGLILCVHLDRDAMCLQPYPYVP